MSGVMAMITLNSDTYCLQYGYFYLNLTIFVMQFMKFFTNCVTNLSNLSKNNHLEGNMYNFSMLSLPLHLKYNFLIVSKTSFLDFHGRGCDFSKGDSSLSSVCLAGNVDYLEGVPCLVKDTQLDN